MPVEEPFLDGLWRTGEASSGMVVLLSNFPLEGREVVVVGEQLRYAANNPEKLFISVDGAFLGPHIKLFQGKSFLGHVCPIREYVAR
jgi:hypothetical protein